MIMLCVCVALNVGIKYFKQEQLYDYVSCCGTVFLTKRDISSNLKKKAFVEKD